MNCSEAGKAGTSNTNDSSSRQDQVVVGTTAENPCPNEVSTIVQENSNNYYKVYYNHNEGVNNNQPKYEGNDVDNPVHYIEDDPFGDIKTGNYQE